MRMRTPFLLCSVIAAFSIAVAASASLPAASNRCASALAFVGRPRAPAAAGAGTGTAPSPIHRGRRRRPAKFSSRGESSRSAESEDGSSTTAAIRLEDLTIMDVVLFVRRNTGNAEGNASDGGERERRRTTDDSSSPPPLELGAVQENGNLAPLSAWTLESAYGGAGSADAVEFVVDEEDMVPGLVSSDVEIISVLEGDELAGYGSRQVGGGKGPGNPHGEESELLYYIDRKVVEGGTTTGGDGRKVLVVVNPDLEVLW